MLRSEKGASAVEFALISPLLFVLTFGIIEFGLLLFDKAVITNASREGARAAIVHRHNALDADEIRSLVTNVVTDYANGYLVNLGVSGSNNLTDSDIVISYSAGIPTPGEDLTVTVNYTYDFLVFSSLISLIGGSFDGNINLIGTTVMRME